MGAIELADAKVRLDELLERVEAGEAVDICRHGKAVARLTAIAAPRKPIDLAMLRALTSTLPPQRRAAGDLVRAMRDDDRAGPALGIPTHLL